MCVCNNEAHHLNSLYLYVYIFYDFDLNNKSSPPNYLAVLNELYLH